jgi:hypothetical protein
MTHWACNGPGTTWHLVTGKRTACGRRAPTAMPEGGDIRVTPRCKTCRMRMGARVGED